MYTFYEIYFSFYAKYMLKLNTLFKFNVYINVAHLFYYWKLILFKVIYIYICLSLFEFIQQYWALSYPAISMQTLKINILFVQLDFLLESKSINRSKCYKISHAA